MIKLVVIRHGQSEWNLANKFTGWTNVELSENGVNEAKAAGKLLKEKGFTFDLAFTSSLKRAQNTLAYVLQELNLSDIETRRSYLLNERHYGALQGLNKAETALKYGDEQVRIWRRSAEVRPPALDFDDPRHPRFDENLKGIDPKELPAHENLLDTVERVVKYWESDIKPALLSGKKVIIAAHGNSLRALYKYINNVSTEDIMGIELPTGKPLVFEFDDKLNIKETYYV